MLKNIKRIPLVMTALLLAFTAMVAPVGASSMTEDAGFSVSAVIPENQIHKGKTYFDLKMKPGQQQELSVSVVNPNSWDIDVTVEAISASTNRNGIINYTAPTENREPTLLHAFDDLAEVGEQRITVPANSTREVTVSVTMPQEEYDGMILGSLRFLRLPTQEEENAATMIVNQYSYVIGVRLRETDTVVAPDFELGVVDTELVNYRAAVTAPVRNIVPEMVSGATVSGELFEKGGTDALIRRTQTDVQMAPNSIYPFSFVDEAGYGFAPGEYSTRLTVEYEGETWSFERDFSIAKEQASDINQGALNQQQNAPTALGRGVLPLWMLVLIVVVALLIIAAGIILLRIHKSNREFNQFMQEMQMK